MFWGRTFSVFVCPVCTVLQRSRLMTLFHGQLVFKLARPFFFPPATYILWSDNYFTEKLKIIEKGQFKLLSDCPPAKFFITFTLKAKDQVTSGRIMFRLLSSLPWAMYATFHSEPYMHDVIYLDLVKYLLTDFTRLIFNGYYI